MPFSASEQMRIAHAGRVKNSTSGFVHNNHMVTMPKHCSAINCKNRDVGETRDQKISFHR